MEEKLPCCFVCLGSCYIKFFLSGDAGMEMFTAGTQEMTVVVSGGTQWQVCYPVRVELRSYRICPALVCTGIWGCHQCEEHQGAAAPPGWGRPTSPETEHLTEDQSSPERDRETERQVLDVHCLYTVIALCLLHSKSLLQEKLSICSTFIHSDPFTIKALQLKPCSYIMAT